MKSVDARLAFASTLFLVLVAAAVPPFVHYDQAIQLHAVQRFVAGGTPSPNHTISADGADLTRDIVRWETWWAPAFPLLAWPLAAVGLSLAIVVRLFGVVALVAGVSGWLAWWRAAGASGWMLAGVALVLPWLRVAHNALLQFSGDALAFAVTPWLLVWTLHVRHAPTLQAAVRRALCLGAAVGGGYWLKYSIAFAGAGCLLVLVADLFRARTQPSPDRSVKSATAAVSHGWVPSAAACAVALMFVIAHSAMSVAAGSPANILAASAPLSIAQGLLTMLSSVALIPEAMADFGAMTAVIVPSRPTIHAIALPAGVFIAWVVWSALRRSRDRADFVAAVVVVATVVLVGVARMAADGPDGSERHVQAAAMAVAPFVVLRARDYLRRGSGLARAACVAGLLIYLALPAALYGPAGAATKLRRAWGFRPGPSGLYNPNLADRSVPDVISALQAEITDSRAIWHLADPLTPLDLPVRALVVHADAEPLEILAARSYRTSEPRRVHALLPRAYETNGKGAAIRGAFAAAGQWRSRPVPGSRSALWTTVVHPSTPPEKGLPH